MPRKPKASKKTNGVPSVRMLDSNAARAELEAKGMPEDPGAVKMLSATDEKLKDKTKAQQ